MPISCSIALRKSCLRKGYTKTARVCNLVPWTSPVRHTLLLGKTFVPRMIKPRLCIRVVLAQLRWQRKWSEAVSSATNNGLDQCSLTVRFVRYCKRWCGSSSKPSYGCSALHVRDNVIATCGTFNPPNDVSNGASNAALTSQSSQYFRRGYLTFVGIPGETLELRACSGLRYPTRPYIQPFNPPIRHSCVHPPVR